MILEFDPDYVQEAEEFGVEIKKVIARNGHHIKIETWCRKEYENLSTDNLTAETYPVLGYDIDSETPNATLSWKRDGTYFVKNMEHPLDLMYMEINDVTSI